MKRRWLQCMTWMMVAAGMTPIARTWAADTRAATISDTIPRVAELAFTPADPSWAAALEQPAQDLTQAKEETSAFTALLPDIHLESVPLPSAALMGLGLLSITAAHSFGRRRRRFR